MSQQFPNEDSNDLVELPKRTKIETEKMVHWDGYTQNPRAPVSPYKNKENIKKDKLIIQGILKSKRFFGEAARYSSLEKESPSKLPELTASKSNKSVGKNMSQPSSPYKTKSSPFKRETQLLQNKWNHRYNDSIVRKGGNEFVVNMKKLNTRSNL